MTQYQTFDAGFIDSWISMPGWHINEQAALMLELNPDEPIPDDKIQLFELLIKILSRAEEMRIIKSPMLPLMFIKWADLNPLPVAVPERLRSAVLDPNRKRWKSSKSINQRQEKAKRNKKGQSWPGSRSSYRTAMAAVFVMATAKYGFKVIAQVRWAGTRG